MSDLYSGYPEVDGPTVEDLDRVYDNDPEDHDLGPPYRWSP